MECKICSKLVLSREVGSPFYCAECNAQIALVAERLTRTTGHRRPLMAVADQSDY